MKKILLGFIFICACVASYSHPSDINITKSEGAYIKANFRTFFGRNPVCQNIGRTYVNFPDIYDDNRPDLDTAMLNLIKKEKSYNGQEQVGKWYFDNCVVTYPSGMKRIKALEYFYGHMMYFEGDQ